MVWILSGKRIYLIIIFISRVLDLLHLTKFIFTSSNRCWLLIFRIEMCILLLYNWNIHIFQIYTFFRQNVLFDWVQTHEYEKDFENMFARFSLRSAQSAAIIVSNWSLLFSLFGHERADTLFFHSSRIGSGLERAKFEFVSFCRTRSGRDQVTARDVRPIGGAQGASVLRWHG